MAFPAIRIRIKGDDIKYFSRVWIKDLLHAGNKVNQYTSRQCVKMHIPSYQASTRLLHTEECSLECEEHTKDVYCALFRIEKKLKNNQNVQ